MVAKFFMKAAAEVPVGVVAQMQNVSFWLAVEVTVYTLIYDATIMKEK